MKKLIQVLTVYALPLALLACNKSSNDPVENIQQAQNEPGLQGKIFRGPCDLKILDGIVSGIATAGQATIKSAREDYQFVGANVTRTTRAYGSSDCTGGDSLLYRETGIVTVAEASTAVAGAKTIDFEMEKVTVQVMDANGQKVAEELRLCGSDNWADRSERDVTAQSASLTCYQQKVPNKDANIFRVDGKVLVFGAKAGVSDTRPEALNNDKQYVAD